MENQQRGTLDVLLIPVILLSVFLIGAAIFGYWAFTGRQNYKNNVQQLVTVAVNNAVRQAQINDAAKYAQAEKYPLATFTGPASFASVSFEYPKTWSAYVPEEPSTSVPINGYFYPAVVPDVNGKSNSYALRVQLIEQPYAAAMQKFQRQVSTGTLSVEQYIAPKLPSIIGSKLQGQISSNKQGTMIVLPVLNMTLEVWTESPQFQSDFLNSVLPSLTFKT